MLSVIVEVRLQHRCLRELMFVYLSQELVSRAWGLHIRKVQPKFTSTIHNIIIMATSRYDKLRDSEHIMLV